jgi:sterol desaturase/sphingolipid hydroxylase (fatty acid hydroxylase superfamily)
MKQLIDFLTSSGVQSLMAAVLFAIVIAIFWTLSHRNRSATSKIDLDDLLIGEDGRMSKSAVVMFGSFALTTWLMVYLALSGLMTEGYFMAYGTLWIAPAVTKLIKGPSA